MLAILHEGTHMDASAFSSTTNTCSAVRDVGREEAGGGVGSDGRKPFMYSVSVYLESTKVGAGTKA